MKILFLGDIVGRVGREAVIAHVPILRQQMLLDAVIVNAENAAGGFGMTPEICEELFEAGVDIISSGNHFLDQKQIIPYFEWQTRLLRPLNCLPNTPGQGATQHILPNDQTIVVINIMGQLFMPQVEDPFDALEEILKYYQLKCEGVDAIIVDVHAETNSEKMSLAHLVDGKVSGVFGTHTHIPTADARILTGGTAFITDAGMCGDYNSSIGMNKDISLARFRRIRPTPRLEPANGSASLAGIYIETDERTGLAIKAQAFRLGPHIEKNAFLYQDDVK